MLFSVLQNTAYFLTFFGFNVFQIVFLLTFGIKCSSYSISGSGSAYHDNAGYLSFLSSYDAQFRYPVFVFYYVMLV